MSTNYIDRFAGAQTLHRNVTAPTAAPTASTMRWSSRGHTTVTTYISFTGTVNGTLRLWLHNGHSGSRGKWFKGASWPLDSSVGDESIDWDVGGPRGFTFQVESISGGGSVTVEIEGV